MSKGRQLRVALRGPRRLRPQGLAGCLAPLRGRSCLGSL